MQVTGPAAALSVMVLGLSQRFGTVGVAAACLLIGVLQLILSFSGAGRLGKYVPESVLAGFTSGVGIKLLDSQIPELLGFPEVVNYQVIDLAMMMHRPQWLHHVSWVAVVSGLTVAFTIVALSKYKRLPAAAISVAVVTFVSVYVGWKIERVRDIGEVLSILPDLSVPIVADENWLDLAVATLPLGLLAALESLLSAQALDRMTKNSRPHEPNLELFGQGLANFTVGLFSGMPVTGVVVRSGVNVQSGGTNRLSSLLHGLLLAGLILTLAPAISSIPQAALAGLLCVVGFRLIEWRTLTELAKKRESGGAKGLLDEQHLVELAQRHDFKSGDDLLAAIGFGDLGPQGIAAELLERQRPPEPEPKLEPAPAPASEPKRTREAAAGVSLDGVSDILSQPARCCSPVPGDEVIGWVTRGRGIMIHRRDCTNIIHCQEPERLVDIDWGRKAKARYPHPPLGPSQKNGEAGKMKRPAYTPTSAWIVRLPSRPVCEAINFKMPSRSAGGMVCCS